MLWVGEVRREGSREISSLCGVLPTSSFTFRINSTPAAEVELLLLCPLMHNGNPPESSRTA